MSSRPVLSLRALALGAALAPALGGAALGAGFVAVTPGFPTPQDTVIVEVLTWEVTPEPCVVWRLGERTARTIRIEGATVPPAVCPITPQPLALGRLAAGSYTITARVDGATEPYAEVRVAVSSSPVLSRVPFDVALSPPTPRAGEPFALVFSLTANAFLGVDFSAPPTVIGDLVVLDGDAGTCYITCPVAEETTGWRHVVPGLTAGDKTVEIRDLGNTMTTFGFHVDDDATALSAAGGAFRISLRWTDRAGAEHDAIAARLTEESGQFWFFAPSNPEVTVKLVDGTGFNDHWWVFVSSMTDLGFTVSVQSTLCNPGACLRERTYTQLPGRNRNFIDTSAFPSCANCSP